jgi:sodium-dependent dicarboxylate transporter 2/3/5
MSPGGRRALAIFFLTALLLVLRADINLGDVTLPGWAGVLGLGGFVDDGVVAMFGVALMFACPSGAPPTTGAVPGGITEGPVSLARRLELLATEERVLTWEVANGIPWYIVLLFGGGLALADAFGTTGLSTWLGDQLVWLRGASPWLIVLVLCLGMSLLTEVTSNTATTTLVVPVMFSVAGSLDVPPLLLMWPATLCASAAFILPISTPPNAIAAGAVDMKPFEMARSGIGLNMIAVVIVTLVTMLWMAPRLGL